MRSLLSFVLVASLPAIVGAAVLPDQTAPTGISRANVGAGNAVDWSQTFTVGLAGTLDSVGLWLSREPVVTQPLLLTIRTTAGGVPTEPDAGANVLASLSIPAASITNSEAFYTYDLSSFAIPVSVGDVLAVALQSNDPGDPANGSVTYHWGGNATGTYAGGAAYIRFTAGTWGVNPADRGFTTFVSAVPEPAAVPLLAAVAGLVTRRRRAAR